MIASTVSSPHYVRENMDERKQAEPKECRKTTSMMWPCGGWGSGPLDAPALTAHTALEDAKPLPHLLELKQASFIRKLKKAQGESQK